ncbi:hypothetical protein CC86DRAFT_454050 [Ophiobolus disseminans]|uniref:Uncharacterized protein n=1 Tax=Ophiobolus disseminans TaxID=1469910 RepID=A0A6A7A820_9PLEO|nr:hypothetical protein CC86DRAFT_454050 [Ophiobolus disseminans]
MSVCVNQLDNVHSSRTIPLNRMSFQKLIVRFRRALLCCSKRDQKFSLDIGSPTNVCRVDISDALPGLTDAERKYIREKASSDAMYLLDLQSQPPSYPPAGPPSPTESPSPSLSPSSRPSSREPSVALLNAASTNLPSAIPTPPCQRHNESSPPAARMKSMWDRPERNSIDTDGGEVYEDLEREHKGLDESFMTLNLEFDFEGKKTESSSLQTLNLSEGFEMQDTVGGHVDDAVRTPPSMKRNKVIERAITSTSVAGSDSEGKDLAEGSPLERHGNLRWPIQDLTSPLSYSPRPLPQPPLPNPIPNSLSGAPIYSKKRQQKSQKEKSSQLELELTSIIRPHQLL